MKKRFTEEQIVAILREAESGQKTVEQICRERSISQPTYYAWKRRYASMAEPDVRRAARAGEGERAAEAFAGRT